MQALGSHAWLAARTTALATLTFVIGLLGCSDDPPPVDTDGPIKVGSFYQLSRPLPQQGETFAPLQPGELLENAPPVPPLTKKKLSSGLEWMSWNLQREGLHPVDPALETPRWRIVALSAEHGEGGMRWPCAVNQLLGDWPWPWNLCDGDGVFGSPLHQYLHQEPEFMFVALLDTKERKFSLVSGVFLESKEPRDWSAEISEAVYRLFWNLGTWRSN